METHPCIVCSFPIPSDAHFCPNCGRKLEEQEQKITVFKQITLYLISFFLPPFGLVPGIKYLRQDDPQAKKVGAIALVLTLISIIFTIIFTIGFINQFNTAFSAQLNQSQDIPIQ